MVASRLSFWDHKKILVTGAQGFVGSFLLENLINKRGVSRDAIRTPSSSSDDLRKWENCLKAVNEIDVIIHLAANVGGIGYNVDHPGSLFYDNAIMGIQLMEAARLSKVEKSVIIGTVCAYPKYTNVPFEENDLWEGYPEETNAPYGLAKKMLLVQSQAYRKQYNFNSIYLLPTNLYGPRDNFHPEYSHVIPSIILKIDKAIKENKGQVHLWGTGQPSREFLYVKDAVEGILLATEHYNKSEPINLGTGNETTIHDLARLIATLMNYTGEIIFNPQKPDGQPRRSLDIRKAEKEFYFKSITPLKTGLIESIKWYQKQSFIP